MAGPIRMALNPALDVAALARRFASAGRLQIADFLAPGAAEALRADLVARGGWRRVINGGDTVFEVSPEDYAAMDAAQREAIDHAVFTAAANGFQFRYESVRVPDAPAERAARGWVVDDFARLMSAPETLDILARVTGIADLGFADAQATLYRPGDFLTRHDDHVAGKNRRLAYVLGLTPGWRPEWGGLLIFPDSDDAVLESFVPRFGALTLFAVPMQHSVGSVAPYAPAPRISVTGWVRANAL